MGLTMNNVLALAEKIETGRTEIQHAKTAGGSLPVSVTGPLHMALVKIDEALSAIDAEIGHRARAEHRNRHSDVSAARSALDAKPQIEVRIAFDDGSQESRTWTWADVKAGRQPGPAIAYLQEWMVDPRKTWAHPQDPIIYSTLVAEGREQEARQWLSDL